MAQVTRGLFDLPSLGLNPVRRIIPSIGGLDFSPIVVILPLELTRRAADSLVAG